ncbi:MAG TPA: DUF1549 and DUF1553 domain-containing protein [Pirellulaceae bacterium]|nr:DUF1549 and DUF1553 domain-containing protein [Pirellulaceae bacterium]
MPRMAACFVSVAVLSVAFGVAAADLKPSGSSARSTVATSSNVSSYELARLIDERIDARLKTAGIPASAVAADAEFLRRVYLDLHGVVPGVERVRSFLADDSADKRTKLIDELLADPRFAAHLADIWDDYLIPVADDPRYGKQRLAGWLEEAFRSKSWDRLAYELLIASGQRDQDAEVTYMLKGRETLSPAELTDLVSQYFLGMRLNCAQCHDHPFAPWTQHDYWGVAAFFTQIQYTDRRQLKSGVIRDDPAVDVGKLEDADKLRTPRFLDGTAPPSGRDAPLRQTLARWITSPENPYFARAMVNRMWSQFFGRGLVEPVDDMHEGNSATHPELLDELTEQFVASGFDLRFLARAISHSTTYQRTSMPAPGNEEDTTLYSRMAIKVLTPEQLYDSLSVVIPATSGRKPFGRNADPREEFVQFFRSEGDPLATAYERGIPQTLRMMNSPDLFSPRNESATVRRIVEPAAPASEAINCFYLHVLARRPTDDERRILDDFLAKHPGNREQAYAEILWSLINSSEFSLNH